MQSSLPQNPTVSSAPASDGVDLAALAGAAPHEADPADRFSPNQSGYPSSLERLVARIHRSSVAPWGYRYVANIDVADFSCAVRVIRQTALTGDLCLITPAVTDAGDPVPDVALYVRNGLPDPEAFWILFHALCRRHAA